MCSAWSRSRDSGGSIVTNGMSVRSSVGQPRVPAACRGGLLDLVAELGGQLELVLDHRDPLVQRSVRRLLGGAHPHDSSRHAGPPLRRSVRPAWARPRVCVVLILLPPSEGKCAPRRGKPLDLDALAFPDLRPHRGEVLDALVALCTTDDPAPPRRCSGSARPRPTRSHATPSCRPRRPPARTRSTPACSTRRSTSRSLDAAARRRATAPAGGHVGAVRAAAAERPDPGVPALRRRPPARHRHGRRRTGASASTRPSARRPGDGLVVDLRSSTYAAFWRPAADLAARVVTVRVLHESGGTRKVVSHFNKATKGRIVRALLEDGANPRTPARFADHLGGLGWKVERAAPRQAGHPARRRSSTSGPMQRRLGRDAR